MSRNPTWPDSWIGWWVAADDKAVLINRQGAQMLVTVCESRGGQPYESAELLGGGTRRIEDLVGTPLRSKRGNLYLEVEAGTPELGPAYQLYPGVDGGSGDFSPATSGQVVNDVILYPSTSIGLYDDFEDDFGVPWGEPLLPFRWIGPAHEPTAL